MNNKNAFRPTAVGGASLLTIFAVLCLAVFSLLSISTVRAAERLGDANFRAVSDYYTAESQAHELLARLRAGEMPEGVEENCGVYSYTCPIGESQTLAVELRAEKGEYTILRWQAISTAQWQADEELNVWDGRQGG